MMTNLGLACIVFGWSYQLFHAFKNDLGIQATFIISYALGVFFLIVGDTQAQISNFISLNGLSLLVSLILLIVVMKKR